MKCILEYSLVYLVNFIRTLKMKCLCNVKFLIYTTRSSEHGVTARRKPHQILGSGIYTDLTVSPSPRHEYSFKNVYMRDIINNT